MADYTKDSAGAPVGSYVKGDTVTDSEGTVWTCVVTGNPAQFEAGSAGGAVDASDVAWDGTESDVDADNVQEALDEAFVRIADTTNYLNTVAATADDASTKTLSAWVINGDTALTAEDSGRSYTINAPAIITLPAALEGLNFSFVVNGAGSIAVSFAAAAGDNFSGGVWASGDSAFHAASSSPFAVGNGDANPGDRIDLRAIDVTTWVMSGYNRSWAA